MLEYEVKRCEASSETRKFKLLSKGTFSAMGSKISFMIELNRNRKRQCIGCSDDIIWRLNHSMVLAHIVATLVHDGRGGSTLLSKVSILNLIELGYGRV